MIPSNRPDGIALRMLISINPPWAGDLGELVAPNQLPIPASLPLSQRSAGDRRI